MENGTVEFKDSQGRFYTSKLGNMRVNETSVSLEVQGVLSKSDHPAPFNDGKYVHYTRFHPQLRDMIGTEGYFYDFVNSGFPLSHFETLRTVDLFGYPCDGLFRFAYFAVPIKPEKTEITLQ